MSALESAVLGVTKHILDSVRGDMGLDSLQGLRDGAK